MARFPPHCEKGELVLCPVLEVFWETPENSVRRDPWVLAEDTG